jgi:hypothetical protein
LEIIVKESFINRISILLMGLPWDKEDTKDVTTAKRLFFHQNERPKGYRNGIKGEILPPPLAKSGLPHHQVYHL